MQKLVMVLVLCLVVLGSASSAMAVHAGYGDWAWERQHGMQYMHDFGKPGAAFAYSILFVSHHAVMLPVYIIKMPMYLLSELTHSH